MKFFHCITKLVTIKSIRNCTWKSLGNSSNKTISKLFGQLLRRTLKMWSTTVFHAINTTEANFDKLHPNEMPEAPWMLLYAYICGPLLGNNHVLIIIDAYSKYPGAFVIKSTPTKTLIKTFEYRKSIPYWPIRNGEIERFYRTFLKQNWAAAMQNKYWKDT